MSQISNENESENENLGTIETYRSPSIRTLENEELEDCVLAKFKNLGSRFPDNSDKKNLVSIVKKGKRKERLNKLNGLDKERRKKQNQQQSPLFSHYLENVNDVDILIKVQERLRIKHDAPKKNKNVKIQDCKQNDDEQEFNVNHESSFQMNGYAKNQKDFDTNKQPLYRLPRSQSQLSNVASSVADDNTRGVYNFEYLQENEEIIPKSKKYGSQNHSYVKYKAKLQDKARPKIQGTRLNEDTIDDEYKEVRKQKRRERMAEIARESRNLSMNVSEENDENIEYWENLTPDNIGWSKFLLMLKENDQSRGTLFTSKSYNYQGNVSNALASEQSFNQILKERYILQPTIDENEELQVANDGAAILTHPRENEAESAGTIDSRGQILKKTKSLQDQKPLSLQNDGQSTLHTTRQSFQPKPQIPLDFKTNLQSKTEQSNQPDLVPQSLYHKFSSNHLKLPKKIQEVNSISKPLLEKPTQSLHLEETLSRQNYIPQSIAKVQTWLEQSEEFDEPEKIKSVESCSQIPSNDTDGDDSSSEDISSDDDDSANNSSKKLLDLLSKIRSTKKKIESRDKVSLERHQTLEAMQKIVTDLIEKYEVISVHGKKVKNGKKLVRELLETITGKHTRDIIDALSLSLDRPPNDFNATSNSLDALLKQLQKAIEGFQRVEGQLTRKEKRLEIALEVAQDLVDKRLDLINWERRLKKQEQSINDIASRVGRSGNSNEINHQNDGSGYFGSVLESLFGKNDSGMENMIKSREDASLVSQHSVYTEEDWEKIFVRLTPESEKNEFISDNEFDGQNYNDFSTFQFAQKQQCKNEDLNKVQDVKNDTTTQLPFNVNQMTSISQMDEYLLLLAGQENMKDYLNQIGDHQQNIKDYLSKVDHSYSSAINAECFRTNVPTEEGKNFISKTKFEDVENNKLDKEIVSDSDQEELTSKFNGLNFLDKNLARPKSISRVSKISTCAETPTTESLACFADVLQNKSHQRPSSSWVNDDQGNKANTFNGDFFINAERKLGGIFADLSQTSSEKDFEFPQTKVDSNTHNNIGTELNFNLTNIGIMKPDHINISTSEKFSPLGLRDNVGRLFPVHVIPQIPENTQNDPIFESTVSMNSKIAQKELEIPNFNIEGTQEKEKNNFLESSDNVNNNNESGLDFSEIVNSLPGWKSFVSLLFRKILTYFGNFLNLLLSSCGRSDKRRPNFQDLNPLNKKTFSTKMTNADFSDTSMNTYTNMYIFSEADGNDGFIDIDEEV
ncbi:10342_t:CDS:2 [Funneliformis caledonium]|uniref:10342_t:CDS:1 n=1 Tax=Funneliformis caledonium TaxID=1117310 RepID=A0A9N9AKM2_9GLOM|nr:10342_t:CDS:2 [Funneliformis caledonium]